MILRANEQQLCHDVVGQENLGRVLAEFAVRGFGCLAGVLGKGYRETAARATLVAVLQFFQRLPQLRVDQGVHRVDDQGRDAVPGCRLASQRLDDREEVGEALAGARAAGDDKALAGPRLRERLDLMLVQVKGLGVGSTKDGGGLLVQLGACGQFIDSCLSGIRGTDLQKKIRPQIGFLHQSCPNELAALWRRRR